MITVNVTCDNHFHLKAMYFIIVFVGLLLFYNLYWKRRHLPPGPTPLPIFGNTRTLAKYAPGYKAFQLWANKYGPVYTIWIGEVPYVIVTDYQVIIDAFVKEPDACAGRNFLTEMAKCLRATHGLYGIARTSGQQWREARRFTMQALRNLGMGKSGAERVILLQAESFIKSVEDEINEGIEEHDLKSLIDEAVGSIINQFVFGFQFHGDKKAEFLRLKSMLDEQSKIMSNILVQMVLSQPSLRFLPIFSTQFEKFNSFTDKFYQFFDTHIEARMVERKERLINEGPTDFVDAFLCERESLLAKGSPDADQYFTIDSMRGICFDLFVAGQETTSSTIRFLALYMVLDQRVQRKMQDELDRVIGGANHQVTTAERSNLPYTQAVINETQRVCNLLPNNLSRKTTRDVIINGHLIKKDTNIIQQISCVLYDEKIFPKPELFLPERFIDDNGALKRCEELIPFSVGKHSCIGEGLARMELFLFTANWFNKYRMYPVDPLSPPTAEKVRGLTVAPHHFKCRIEKRD